MNQFKEKINAIVESHNAHSQKIIDRSSKIVKAMDITLDELRIMIDEEITFRIDHKYSIAAKSEFLKPYGWTAIAYIKNHRTSVVVKQDIDDIIKKIEKMAK